MYIASSPLVRYRSFVQIYFQNPAGHQADGILIRSKGERAHYLKGVRCSLVHVNVSNIMACGNVVIAPRRQIELGVKAAQT